MSSIKEKLAKSLTAETIELIPYLPYILQDLWELGSSPKDIIDLISKHIKISKKTKVLDLACGKGAVSVHLAKATACKVKGVDIIPDFIEFANKKANEYGVESLCEFVVGDITETVEDEKDYDIVIFGAVGDVLGTPEETISKLKNSIKPEGYIVIDDAFDKKGANIDYYTREEWLLIFDKEEVRLIDEKIIEDDELMNLNNEQQGFIAKRANELKKEYPEKAHLFDTYIHSQQAECNVLENDILGVTLLIQKNRH